MARAARRNAVENPASRGSLVQRVEAARADYLFDVRPGGDYGHPDPPRGHYLLGGNPTAGVNPEEFASGPDGGFIPWA